jgi:uncharacterized membrane protein
MRDLLYGHLKRRADAGRLAPEIAAAERGTTGRIVVAIAPHFSGDARAAAQRAFRRYALHRTNDRNGVLIFVIPSRREFVIWADAGIFERLGQAYWDHLSAMLARQAKEGDLTQALAFAIDDIGKQLASHFPARDAG